MKSHIFKTFTSYWCCLSQRSFNLVLWLQVQIEQVVLVAADDLKCSLCCCFRLVQEAQVLKAVDFSRVHCFLRRRAALFQQLFDLSTLGPVHGQPCRYSLLVWLVLY